MAITFIWLRDMEAFPFTSQKVKYSHAHQDNDHHDNNQDH